MSMVVLISLEGELDTGSPLVPNAYLLFPRLWVRSEVTGVGEEGLLAGNVNGSGGGVVMAGAISGEDVDPVSFTEARLRQETSSSPLLMAVISFVCRIL